jgi:hypothetical protein
MKELGWEEGRNIRFQFLWAGGQSEQLPVLACELVTQKIDLITTFGNPALLLAKIGNGRCNRQSARY